MTTPNCSEYLANATCDLGDQADQYDVEAFNAALEAAWQTTPPANRDEATKLTENVVNGRRGDWVRAASAARDAQ